ncbi:MAG: exopolysaccharide biosynthesis polyprenyl glycosylphosphotransferase [bacterium]|nr:exopolysaccharide biosynthesis polyprenyl glycosylphosphotransferase [bacterium]
MNIKTFYKFLNIAGIFIIILFSSYLSWGTLEFWKVKEGIIMVSLILVAHIISSLVISRLIIFPRIEHLGIVFTIVSFTFLLVIGIIATGRFYYSRTFLLSSYILDVTLLMLCNRKKKKLNLGIIPFDHYEELLKIINDINWHVLQSPKNIILDGIVVSSLEKLDSEWSRYIVTQKLKGIPIYHVSEIYESMLGKLPLSFFYVELIEDFNQSLIMRFTKRLFDIVLSSLLFPIFLLLALIISIFIKLDSEGPVFFTQERVGQGGKIYKIVKFRTMYRDADINGPRFTEEDDPRITPVGKILRRFHLDELPQIWNILKGDMSFIGPRPEQAKIVEEFERKIPFYNYRHLVKPGITGWAQVNQGYAAGISETIEKLEYDLYYVKNLSLWLDVVIIIKTIKILITSWGAR